MNTWTSAIFFGLTSLLFLGLQIPSVLAWWQPTPGTTFHIQFQGDTDPHHPVDSYDVDMFDTPQAFIETLQTQNKTVICYISAGSFESWRPDAKSFPKSVKGRSNGWPGERWLDIRRLDILGPIMKKRMNLAQSKGCEALDFDNVDGYTNLTGFKLTYADQLRYNKFLAQEAHARGMAVGLKNDLNQIDDLVDSFDFAINESCFDYDECDLLTPFIQKDKAVFMIEYNLPPDDFCDAAQQMGLSAVAKNYSLDAWADPCWD